MINFYKVCDYMFEPKNCKSCGRVFFSARDEICPACKEKEDEDYKLVRTFLKEFPGSSVHIVMEYTGVPEKRIMRFLREGRIEIFESDQSFLTCLKCGKPIQKGKYCKECYSKFKGEVTRLYESAEQSPADAIGKMRFLNNKD